jgi:hypothetical protein
VGEAEHQSGIGAGTDRHPLRLDRFDQVLGQGGEVDESDPTIPAGVEPAAQHVPALTPVLDLAVLDRHPPEGHHQFGVLRDLDEVGLLVHVVVEGEPEHVRGDDMAGCDRVVVDRIGVPADRVEEAVDLALGVVEAAGAGPAVAAPEDRLVAVLVADPVQLGGEQVEGHLPFHLHERLPAA